MLRSLTITILILSVGVLAYFLFQDDAGAILRSQSDDESARLEAGDPIADDTPSGHDPSIATVPFTTEAPTEDEPARQLDVVVLESASRVPVGGAEVTSCDTRALWRILREKGVVHGTPEGRRIMRDMSTSAVTDANGIARLPVEGRMFLVQARQDGLWGMQLLTAIPDKPVEILLVDEQVLQVRVVSPTGESLASVPIALRRKVSDEPTWSYKITATESPHGIGTFEHMQRRFEQGDGWHVTFAFPMVRQPRLAVSRNGLPQDPLVLPLSGAGGLEVRVQDENGKPVGGEVVRLDVTASPHQDLCDPIWDGGPWSTPTLHGNGLARIPWLGLGLYLRVTATSTDPDSERKPVCVEIDGPRKGGETVSCLVVVESEPAPSERFPTIVGRFVRKDGTPCSAAEVRAWPRVHPRPRKRARGETVELDSEGRFRMLVRHGCPEGGRLAYRFIEHGTGRRFREVRVDLSRQLPPGVTDLGDIILDHGPLLASGIIVDESGRPVAGARVRLSAPMMVRGQELWPGIFSSGSLESGPDGRFDLHTLEVDGVPPTRLRLSASHKDYLDGPDQDLSPGTRDLRFVLERAGALAGSVRFLPGQSPGDFLVTMQQAGRKETLRLEDDGTFTGTKLRSGLSKLVVSLATALKRRQGDPTVIVDDIAIIPGSVSRDPRIQEIQLAGEPTKVVIRVVDETRSPIQGASVMLAGEGYPRPWTSDHKGVATVHADALPVDLVVRAYGYRTANLGAVREDRRVTLKRGLAVRIETTARTFGHEPRFITSVSPYRVNELTGKHHYVFLHARPARSTRFDETGTTRIVVPEPGTYIFRPHLVVLRRTATGSQIRLTPEPRFRVRDVEEEQVFRLDIPQDLVEKALAEALK